MVVVVGGGAVVVVVVGGGAVVVVVVAGDVSPVSDVVEVVVDGGDVVTVVEVVVLVVGAGPVVGGSESTVDVCGVAMVVVEVGRPMATGVSTTRSRIPATAADAINTEIAVAPSQAAPTPTYLLIFFSMMDVTTGWVKTPLSHRQAILEWPPLEAIRV